MYYSNFFIVAKYGFILNRQCDSVEPGQRIKDLSVSEWTGSVLFARKTLNQMCLYCWRKVKNSTLANTALELDYLDI